MLVNPHPIPFLQLWEGSVCPTVVKKGNWLVDGTYPEEFKVTQDGSSLQVQRTDSDIGWSMDLSFMCKRECEADQKISGSNCMCDDGICAEGSTCVEGKTCTPECEADQKISGSNCICDDGICEEGSTCVEGKTCTPDNPVSCSGVATLMSTSPGQDMVLCKDKTESTCQKDFETLCPAGWNLCTPGQFNNRNDGWDYNWADAKAGYPDGVIYCHGSGFASHYSMDSSNVLNTDEPLNCFTESSRPGCEAYAGDMDCIYKDDSALCCAPTSTCGDGKTQEEDGKKQEEEDCDDGNKSNDDDCLNSCTWKTPKNPPDGSMCE